MEKRKLRVKFTLPALARKTVRVNVDAKKQDTIVQIVISNYILFPALKCIILN